jgi:hypothetical protein
MLNFKLVCCNTVCHLHWLQGIEWVVFWLWAIQSKCVTTWETMPRPNNDPSDGEISRMIKWSATMKRDLLNWEKYECTFWSVRYQPLSWWRKACLTLCTTVAPPLSILFSNQYRNNHQSLVAVVSNAVSHRIEWNWIHIGGHCSDWCTSTCLIFWGVCLLKHSASEEIAASSW